MPKPIVYVDVRAEPAELAAARIAALHVWCAAGGADAPPPRLEDGAGGLTHAALVERLFASPKPVRVLALRWDAGDPSDPDAVWRGPGPALALRVEPVVPGSRLAVERAQATPTARADSDGASGALVSGDVDGESLLLRVAPDALAAYRRDYALELPAWALRSPVTSPLVQAILGHPDSPFRPEWLDGVTEVVYFGRLSSPYLAELPTDDMLRANDPPTDPPADPPSDAL